MLSYPNLIVDGDLGAPLPKTEAEVEVNKAVQRVHSRYGRDLAAFFRDIQGEILREEQRAVPLFRTAAKHP